jgi:hypothetical protein
MPIARRAKTWIAAGATCGPLRVFVSTPPGSYHAFHKNLHQIFFIKFYARVFQQFAVFIQKIHPVMMGLLIFDVFNQSIFIVDGMGKCAIAFLPITELWEYIFLFDPF